MNQCPFCKGAVSVDLLRFGGHCPHCLNEVPGEEEPTDPGIQARKRQEDEARAAAARLQRRNRILTAVVSVVLLGAGGAFYALRPQKPQIVFTDEEIYIAPATAHQNAQMEAQLKAEEEAKAKAAADAKRHSASGRPTTPTSTGPGDLASAGPGLETPSAPAADPESAPSSAEGLSSLTSPRMGGLDLTPRGPAAKAMQGYAMSNSDEIRKMVRAVIDRNYGQLRQCFEVALRQNPTLGGRWQVIFTIEKDGSVSKSEAEGLTMKDRDFEACVARNVKNWKFTPITEDMEIVYPMVFGGSG